MEGITILNEYEYISKYSNFNIIGFILTLLAIITIIFLVSLLIYRISEKDFAFIKDIDFWGITLSIILIITTMLLYPICYIFSSMRKPLEYKKEYQVIINDSIDYNEFYNRYEIIEVNGRIYTIREKE